MAAKVVGSEETKGFEINLNGWRVREFRDFMRALTTNDFDRVAELVAGVIFEWPFEGSPSDPEAFMNLNFAELGQVLRAVNGAMLAAFQSG